jgi:predicted Zn-dependent protease
VDRVALLVSRGEQRVQAGDPLSAIGYFRDAVTHAPRDPRGYLALARTYLETEQPERAVEVYEAALYACGERPDLLLALAEAQNRGDRPEVALLILRTLSERSPSQSEVHERRAEIAERTGRFAEALDARRAMLVLRAARDDADTRDAMLRTRALSLLAGEADRLNRDVSCGEGASQIRRSLADCR